VIPAALLRGPQGNQNERSFTPSCIHHLITGMLEQIVSLSVCVILYLMHIFRLTIITDLIRSDGSLVHTQFTTEHNSMVEFVGINAVMTVFAVGSLG